MKNPIMRRILIVLLVVYAALQIYAITAIASRFWIGMIFTSLSTVVAFIFALLHAGWRMGWRKALLLLGLSFGISLAYESIGVATGYVYGPYHYTDRLGPKFLGLVPYLIPLAWFMMMYPSYIIAETLLRGWPIRRAGALARRPSAAFWQAVGLAALGGLVMTAWDLAMDPMMVAAGNWVWETDGAYFGIPLQNYWGWWLTAFTVYALYGWFSSWFKGAQDRQVLPEANSTGNQPPFDRLAVVSYLMTVTSTLLVAALIGLGGPAMVGAFAAIPWGFGALALLNDPRPA